MHNKIEPYLSGKQSHNQNWANNYPRGLHRGMGRGQNQPSKRPVKMQQSRNLRHVKYKLENVLAEEFQHKLSMPTALEILTRELISIYHTSRVRARISYNKPISL